MSADPNKLKKREGKIKEAKIVIVVGFVTLTILATFWLASWVPII